MEIKLGWPVFLSPTWIHPWIFSTLLPCSRSPVANGFMMWWPSRLSVISRWISALYQSSFHWAASSIINYVSLYWWANTSLKLHTNSYWVNGGREILFSFLSFWGILSKKVPAAGYLLAVSHKLRWQRWKLLPRFISIRGLRRAPSSQTCFFSLSSQISSAFHLNQRRLWTVTLGALGALGFCSRHWDISWSLSSGPHQKLSRWRVCSGPRQVCGPVESVLPIEGDTTAHIRPQICTLVIQPSAPLYNPPQTWVPTAVQPTGL